MTKVKRKLSPAEIDYNKQVKRIRQFIRRAEKRGYLFSDDILPQKPKRITKASVKKLAKLTPDVLYSRGEYVDTSTGEIVSAEQGRRLERSVSARKAAQTRKKKQEVPSATFVPPYRENPDTSFTDAVAITQFRSHVNQFNERASSVLNTWLDRMLNENSLHDVAVMLNRGAEEGVMVTYQVAYSSDALVQYVGKMIEFLPEAGSIYRDEIIDAMEEEEDFNPVE